MSQLNIAMNFSLPDWNIGNETPALMPPKNKPFGLNSDLLELCWENGHVVLNAQPQTHQHHHPPTDHLIQETETVSWIDDPCFDKDFFSEFPLDEEAHRCSTLPSINPPPRFDAFDHRSYKDVVPVQEPAVNKQADHNCFRPSNKGTGNIRTRETVASSHCGSNQVVLDAVDGSPVSSPGIAVAKTKHGNVVGKMSSLQSEKIQTLITSSSSGGSQSSFGRTISNSHKRKTRDAAEDSECQSEDAELQSAPRKKAGLKSRKSRAAEVHNLSERRRRDRINEKMRILQELLPHSNKTDKASMLDEAIEYMKSLQQQLQMMWMGSGMAAAPFMFPGVQHYMSRLAGLGMPQMPLPPSHQNPVQFARLPLQQQQQAARMPNAMYQMQQNQMQSPQQFANYMQFHAMQRASQVNAGLSFGPKTAGNSHMLAPPGNNH